jgi:hypothetical protein
VENGPEKTLIQAEVSTKLPDFKTPFRKTIFIFLIIEKGKKWRLMDCQIPELLSLKLWKERGWKGL